MPLSCVFVMAEASDECTLWHMFKISEQEIILPLPHFHTT